MTGQLQTTNCAYYVSMAPQNAQLELIVHSLATMLAAVSVTIDLLVSEQVSTQLVVACTQCNGHLIISESGFSPEDRYQVTLSTIVQIPTLPLGVYHKLTCKALV